MSRLKDYIKIFYTVAYAHPDIAHRDETDSAPNPSFFTSAGKLESAVKNESRSSDYMLLLHRPVGRFEYGSQLYDDLTCMFDILCKGGDVSQETKQQGVQDKAQQIGFFIAGWLHDQAQLHPFSGPVSGFDINTVQHETIGPEFGGYYGERFRFQMKQVPFNIYDDEGRASIIEAGLGGRIFDTEFDIEFE